MRTYCITVNGQTYDVDVVDKETGIHSKETGDFRITNVQPIERTSHTTVSAPASAPAAPVSSPAKLTGNDIQDVLAPMPGSILMVNVKPGDAIKKGELLLTLEAMKMENEIVANNAGIVKNVYVAKGDAVDSGKVLVSIG